MTSVDRADVKKWAREDSPIVRVDGVEQGREEDASSVSSTKIRAHSPEGEQHNHEGDTIKSSYDVEEDVPPSLYEKLKGSVLGVEDKLRPKDALQAKNADPHPSLTPQGPGMFSHVQEMLWKTTDQAKPNAEADFSSKDAPAEPAIMADDKPGFSSNELGTGYEEDTERGALSSDDSIDSIDKESLSKQREGLSKQPEGLFKPVKENRASDLTLEDVRAKKQVNSLDDVKAPGVLGRAKEEVEAVTDQVMEGLNLKEKRSASGDLPKESVSQGGFFSRIAEKMGYGGHGRSQSH